MTLSRFKLATRAALVAAVLGTGALAAAPAMAQQGEPGSSFSLQVPGGGGGPSAQGAPNARTFGGPSTRAPVPDFDWCMTDRQIRYGLTQYGFRDVRVGRNLGRDRVEVIARWGRWIYSMRVDRCDGNVDRVRRIRPAFGPGFSFNFNF